MNLEERNQKIINAVIQKANTVCPGALALIGINGSFMTGDFYEKSDLDLLILINDDRGWQLGCVFVQDDLQVGHDIYCTTWERLQKDAGYEHPNISKLMDAKIVYCADEKYRERLEALRKTAKDILTATGVNPDVRVKDLPEEDVSKLREFIDHNLHVEGDLRRQTALDIKRLVEIGCYRGVRHRKGLPVRGQRTKTNARTRKGPKRTIANKKK